MHEFINLLVNFEACGLKKTKQNQKHLYLKPQRGHIYPLQKHLCNTMLNISATVRLLGNGYF